MRLLGLNTCLGSLVLAFGSSLPIGTLSSEQVGINYATFIVCTSAKILTELSSLSKGTENQIATKFGTHYLLSKQWPGCFKPVPILRRAQLSHPIYKSTHIPGA